MQRVYSEAQWHIDIDRKLSVTHRFGIHLFHISATLPSVHEELTIGLPAKGSFSNFETIVDGEALEAGYGFRHDRSQYTLRMVDIRRLAKGTPVEIAISFQQRGAVSRLGLLRWYEVGFMPRLLQGSMDLTIKAPIVTGRWQRFIARLLSKLGRTEIVRGIQAIGREPDDEPSIDSCLFCFRDEFPTLSIAFNPQLPIDKASLLSGIIMGVFASVIGGLVLWGLGAL